MARVYNFSAGPSMLPESVLKTAAEEMLDYHGSGQSVMEMSHRSKTYDAIIKECEALLREVMGIPDTYKVLFLQGGASSQFAMLPLNLMNGSGKAEADLYRWATHLNANAAEVLRAMNLKAATDITGFGLGGHLLEMARGSRVVVEIDTASLPFIDNVEAFASDGLIPAGSYANRRHCSCRTFVSPDVDSLRATLVFDAQTSGGLVLAVPQERVEEALERLAALGEPGWLVGHVLPLRDGPQLLLS